MKKFALLAMLAAGCATAQPTQLTTEQKEMAQAGNDFAFRLLQQVDRAENGDWFVSPMSLQFLLDVILNGAGGETAEEIARTLGCDVAQLNAINEYSHLMLDRLGKLDPATKLTIGNAVFVNKIYPIDKNFKNLVEKEYYAEVKNLDFTKQDASLKAINGWCSKQTNGLIPQVLGSIEPSMFAYLLNALYFKGSWTYKFNKGWTEERTFHLESGDERKVMMMEKERKYYYGENELYKKIRIPYGSGEFCMVVLLPKEGHTATEVLGLLNTDSWKEAYSSMSYEKVNLWLPRFESKYHVKLNDILSEMGMARSFKIGQANFKAMSTNADYLDFIQQDTVIKVDEEGSEAAAVSTAGMAGTTAVPIQDPIYEFHADHPFLYFIVEATTKAVIFGGCYTGK